MIAKTEPLHCLCGGRAVTFKNRQGVWGVTCTCCGRGVFGYSSAPEAEQVWSEEVLRCAREAREGN